jgi:hypothetical protein
MYGKLTCAAGTETASAVSEPGRDKARPSRSVLTHPAELLPPTSLPAHWLDSQAAALLAAGETTAHTLAAAATEEAAQCILQ